MSLTSVASARPESHMRNAGENGSRVPRRRILLVAPQPFFTLRGTPLNVLQMLRVLCAAGYEVHLATYAIGETIAMPGLVYHRARSVPGVRHVPIGFSGAKIALDLTLAWLVWRLLLRCRFDLVHAVEEAIFFSLPVARLKGTPIVYDLDSVISQQLAYTNTVRNRALLSLARAVERSALRRSDLAITVCEAVSESVRELHAGTPIAQIEDCPTEDSLRAPNPENVAAWRARLSLEGKRVVLYVGNLESYQGIDLLLEAWPHVAAKHAGARLLLVGGSPEHVTRGRASLGDALATSVIFAGQQPPAQVPDLMALADILVSPRRAGENTPLKLYSYMCAGAPIVATNLRTHRQVLDEMCAVLCEPDARSLASALDAVLTQPARYRELGVAARERVLQRYSPDEFARKLLAAYDQVLTPAPRAAAH